MSDSNDIKIPPQDGPKVYLLCEECEGRFSKHECKYAGFFNNQLECVYSISEDLVLIKDFDYKSIRLFLLSILWRLSVTSIPNFKIELNNVDQEILRKALLSNNPLEPHEFPIATSRLHFDGESNNGLILSPKENKETVDVVIGGILYSFSKFRLDSQNLINYPLGKDKWYAKLVNVRDIKWLMNAIYNIDEI